MKNKNGYALITTVIILSTVMIILAQTLANSSYFQGRSGVDVESKELSFFLAQSCVDKAFFSITQDLDYLGNETIYIDKYTCIIQPITLQGTNTIIQTNATVDQSQTKLVLILDVYLNVVSFYEQ